MAEKTYIAELGEMIYNLIFNAPSLANVHKELLVNVLPAIENSYSKRLLTIGIGPSGSPYHTIPDRFKKLFKNKRFKAVFLDYSPDILTRCFMKYNELGIIGNNGLDSQIIVPDSNIEDISSNLRSKGFQLDIKPKSGFKEKDLEDKLTFFQHDLREPLPKELGDYAIIESSFTLHHAAQYVQTLSDRLNEIYARLDKKGLLHWGTGFGDMSYSEKKIKKIGQEVAKLSNSPVILIDKRQPDYPYKLTFFPGKKPKLEKADESLDSYNQIIIDNEGLVHIPTNLINNSNFLGYSYDGDFFTFPLIDPQKEEDKTFLIKPVHDFYASTNKEIANIKSANPELVQMAVEGDRNEALNARKGLAEYYRSEKDALELLRNSGFSNIEVKRPNLNRKGTECLVNILAYK